MATTPQENGGVYKRKKCKEKKKKGRTGSTEIIVVSSVWPKSFDKKINQETPGKLIDLRSLRQQVTEKS